MRKYRVERRKIKSKILLAPKYIFIPFRFIFLPLFAHTSQNYPGLTQEADYSP